MEKNLLNLLPTELKEAVLKYITNPIDLHNLSIVNNEYESAAKNMKFRKFDVEMDYRFTHQLSVNIFKRIPNVINITQLNLNGIYWLQAAVIRSFITKLTNLEIALLIDTKMACTNLDTQLYNSLKKLKVLAVSTEEESRKNTCTFMVAKYTEQKHYLWNEDDNILCGQKTHFMIVPKRSMEEKYLINEMGLINNIIKCYSTDMAITYDCTDKLVTSYGGLLELITKEDMQDKYSGLKEIIIYNSLKRKSHELPGISIDHFRKFINLKKISLEVNARDNCNFLEKVFKECKCLKSLKIKTRYPQFTLAYLQHATALEDISFSTSGHFQLDKFLLDVLSNNHIKLKRIYLKFWKLQKISEKPFNKFLKDNTQMIFFRIDCDMAESLVKRLKSVLKGYVMSTQQIFQINKCNVHEPPEFFNIPISHVDMLQEYGLDYFNPVR